MYLGRKLIFVEQFIDIEIEREPVCGSSTLLNFHSSFLTDVRLLKSADGKPKWGNPQYTKKIDRIVLVETDLSWRDAIAAVLFNNSTKGCFAVSIHQFGFDSRANFHSLASGEALKSTAAWVCDDVVESELRFVDRFSASRPSGKSVSVAFRLEADAGEKRLLLEITIDHGGRLLWPPPPTMVRRNGKKRPHREIEQGGHGLA
jgi:hypothetical protein